MDRKGHWSPDHFVSLSSSSFFPPALSCRVFLVSQSDFLLQLDSCLTTAWVYFKHDYQYACVCVSWTESLSFFLSIQNTVFTATGTRDPALWQAVKRDPLELKESIHCLYVLQSSCSCYLYHENSVRQTDSISSYVREFLSATWQHRPVDVEPQFCVLQTRSCLYCYCVAFLPVSGSILMLPPDKHLSSHPIPMIIKLVERLRRPETGTWCVSPSCQSIDSLNDDGAGALNARRE